MRRFVEEADRGQWTLLTGVTPLTLYRDWIVQNRSQMGYRAVEFKRRLI